MNGKKTGLKVFIILLTILGNILLTVSCNTSFKETQALNRLQSESSQYLLQHASNPVDWFPWGDEAFSKAKTEEKLLIISIGYYACHWCQVMEKETFMDTTVARLMNDNYVSIKVDREERPDIDQVYAEAAKKMTGTSGWPLNIIATADGTPLFAGTYFENSDWQAIVQRASYLYQDNPEEILAQAKALANTLSQKQEAESQQLSLTLSAIEQAWLSQSDTAKGGIRGNQKFPNSPYLSALLDFTYYQPNNSLDQFLKKTLDNMALGGMFDHLGGGFTRYSTDSEWKIPHFEKMLYDNAQLMGIYAKAYRKFNDPFYLYIAEQTAQCLLNEFKNPEGGYFSSINAVSNEVEGGYYTWTLDEIQGLDQADQVTNLFNISEEGNWENGQNVLFALGSSKEDYLHTIDSPFKEELFNKRAKRTAPPKDEKTITAWNALVLDGFVELYRATFNPSYLSHADALASYLIENHTQEDQSQVSRTEDINQVGFLEDYSLTAGALIQLYQVSFDEQWLKYSERISAGMLELFKAEGETLLKQSSQSDQLFMNSIPVLDTDLPSGNAQAVNNLLMLSEFYYDSRSEWKDKATSMLKVGQSQTSEALVFAGTWIQALLRDSNPPYEVAILGEEAIDMRNRLDLAFRPDIIFLGGNSEGDIPLLAYKLQEGRTVIYVCQNKTCKFPTDDTEKAYEMMIPKKNIANSSISD
ncbi:thioredoxin domain-containing protein [Roseivirga sp. E12]|uniref:thioredoxin domain-containing protein n=1 Tax=Roseivirga sp. E12 TaxID=2819237 RepID=UPI001ABC714E|nr:thioredoxin domain-containing protein [Roseivirga sp. E12]MBO3697036.1 thioredoxin domain-containing protein [Roseivirga sp. E12]